MIITFHGAARTVTGSKHLITTGSGKKILLDCGLYQGRGKDTYPLNKNFSFNPAAIDTLILSHAHIDHSGNIPNLVKQGFSGKIICTPATRQLCELMLMDTAHIQENDLKYLNRRRAKRGERPVEPLYDEDDVAKAMELFEELPFNTIHKIDEETEFNFTEVGHILGAAAVNMKTKENGKEQKLFFTGDIGRHHDNIMKQPSAFPQADYIICESTYGNRLHPLPEESEKILLSIVLETCAFKKGKLVIPAFSLGRTQEIVLALNNLKNKGLLPAVKVYVDSPLSIGVTQIMRQHVHEFNDEISALLKTDADPFDFPGLVYIRDASESKKLNDIEEPCIIISASGMAEAGRIKHHITNTISEKRNTILMVGYCTEDSLGGRLIAGRKEVKIFGDYFDVKAEVQVMNEYSAHGDYNEMLQFLSCQEKSKVKKVFLVHGEYETQQDWRATLMKNGFSSVEIPEMLSEWILN
jgi:metallo-beta-lactamase family protein